MRPGQKLRGRAAAVLLLGATACGESSCGGCLAPLGAPFPEEQKIDRAVQARLTARGLQFLEAELPSIIAGAASVPCGADLPELERVPCPDGSTCAAEGGCLQGGVPRPLLGFRVPASSQESGCYSKVSICEGADASECLAYAELHGTRLTPLPPASLGASLDTEVWSTWLPTVLEQDCKISRPQCCLAPSPDCDVRIARRQRTMSMDLQLRTDNPLGRLEVVVGEPRLALDADDIDLEGHLGCDIADLLMPLVFPLFEDTLSGTLDDAIKSAFYDATMESCAPPAQCPSNVASSCDGDQRCHFASSGRYIPKLLGVEGLVELAELLGEFAAESTEIAISVGAGGYAEVVAGGLELGLRGGGTATPADCAPVYSRPSVTPPRLVFGDAIAPPDGGPPRPYMVGLAVSDALIDRLLDQVLGSGALCQRLDAGISSYLNTGALALLSPSLGRLSRGEAQAAMVELRPRGPFDVDIGAGASGPDPDDPSRVVLLDPLLTIRAHDLDLDMYGDIAGRLVRFMTLRLDLRIPIGLDDDGQGGLMLLVDDTESWLERIEVLNADILADDPSELEAAVPSLVGAIVAQLGPALNQTIGLSSLAGFALQQLTLRGVQPRTRDGAPQLDDHGHAIYEFLGVFADLAVEGTTPSGRAPGPETRATIRQLELPTVAELGALHAAGPRLSLDVDLDPPPDGAVEFSYRVDQGPWRPFQPGTVLQVRDPLLRLMGRHLVEVRGRAMGDPRSLDQTPAAVEVLIDPVPPEVDVDVDVDATGSLAQVRAADAMTPADQLQVRVREDQGPWSSQRGLAPIRLTHLPSAEHRLMVEVTDEAGNTTVVQLGQLPQEPTATAAPTASAPLPPASEPPPSAGCAAASLPPSILVWLLPGLGLWRRRHP